MISRCILATGALAGVAHANRLEIPDTFNMEHTLAAPMSRYRADEFGDDVSGAYGGAMAVAGRGTKTVVTGGWDNEAFVHTYDSLYYSNSAVLSVNTSTSGDWFGYSVDLDNVEDGKLTAAVGAPNENDHGAVYLFRGFDRDWEQSQRLTAPHTEGFGAAVCFDKTNNDVLLVGATSISSNYTGGAAYVYHKMPKGDFKEHQKLGPKKPEPEDGFGYAVSVSNGFAAVSAPYAHGGSGAVYVFAEEAGKYSEVARLVQPDGFSSSSNFGSVLDLTGDTLVVGTNGEAGAEFVTVFRATDPKHRHWKVDQILVTSNPGDGFGSQVTLARDTMVLSSTTAYNNTGVSVVYDRVNGKFVKGETLYGPGVNSGFGHAVVTDTSLFVYSDNVGVAYSIEGVSMECAIIMRFSTFGNDYGDSSLRVTAPDGSSDMFAAPCGDIGYTFYCPAQTDAVGEYKIRLESKGGFQWQNRFYVCTDMNTTNCVLGDDHSDVNLLWNKEEMKFDFGKVKAVDPYKTCESFGVEPKMPKMPPRKPGPKQPPMPPMQNLTLYSPSGDGWWGSSVADAATYEFSDVEGKRVYASGSMCPEDVWEKKEIYFANGRYTMRTSGFLSDLDLSFKFCGELLPVGTHLVFDIKGDNCTVVEAMDVEDMCSEEDDYSLSGTLIIRSSGISAESVTALETEVMEAVLTTFVGTTVEIKYMKNIDADTLAVYFKGPLNLHGDNEITMRASLNANVATALAPNGKSNLLTSVMRSAFGSVDSAVLSAVEDCLITDIKVTSAGKSESTNPGFVSARHSVPAAAPVEDNLVFSATSAAGYAALVVCSTLLAYVVWVRKVGV